MSHENIPRRMYYEILEWVRLGEWPTRIKGAPPDSELPYVDFMVTEIKPEEFEKDRTYETLYGPWEDWDLIERTLGHDYGSEGSRVYPSAA